MKILTIALMIFLTSHFAQAFFSFSSERMKLFTGKAAEEICFELEQINLMEEKYGVPAREQRVSTFNPPLVDQQTRVEVSLAMDRLLRCGTLDGQPAAILIYQKN